MKNVNYVNYAIYVSYVNYAIYANGDKHRFLIQRLILVFQ